MYHSYKEDYKNGKIKKNDYDDCRFSEDKIKYTQDWIEDRFAYKKQSFDINSPNPKNIVELICQEKVNLIKSDYWKLRLYQDWTDKFSVYKEIRELLTEHGMEDITIPLVNYFPKTKYDELSPLYETVPFTFVFSEVLGGVEELTDEHINEILKNCEIGKEYMIKCTHGSGFNIKYKHSLNNEKVLENLKRKLNTWMNINYAFLCGYEIQYKWISPKIIVQELLVNNPLDYSFWCVDGEIQAIELSKKHAKNIKEQIAFVNSEGGRLDWFIGMKPQQEVLSKKQVEIVEEMKKYVKLISSKFKFVRVDMYYINERIYFGETTFTPCAGDLDLSFKS